MSHSHKLRFRSVDRYNYALNGGEVPVATDALTLIGLAYSLKELAEVVVVELDIKKLSNSLRSTHKPRLSEYNILSVFHQCWTTSYIRS